MLAFSLFAVFLGWAHAAPPLKLVVPDERERKAVEEWYREKLRSGLAAEAAKKRVIDFIRFHKDRHGGVEPSKEEQRAEVRRALLDCMTSFVAWNEDWQLFRPTVAAFRPGPDSGRTPRIEISGQYLAAIRSRDPERVKPYNAGDDIPLSDLSLSGTLKHESFHRFLFENLPHLKDGEHHGLMLRYER